MRIKTAVFLFCYIVMLVDITFRYVYGLGDFIHNILNFVALPLLCCVIADNFRGMSFKRIGLFTLIAVVGAATRFISNDNAIMMMTLFILAFKDMDFDRLIKIGIPIRIISLLVLVTLFYMGLTESDIFVRSDGVQRYAYGFGNINNFSSYILSIVCHFIYMDRKKLGKRDILVVLVGLAILLSLTFSRTHIAVLIILLFVVIMKIIKNNKSNKEKRIYKLFITHSFTLMAIISLITYIGYTNGNEFAKKLDIDTSGRISSTQYLVEKHGVALFGQEIDRTTSDGGHRVLDNSYAYLLLYFGPVILGAIALTYSKGTKRLFKNKNNTGAMMIGLYNIAGLMEHFSIEMSMNPFLLLFSSLIYDNVDTKKIVQEGGKNE